MNPIQALAQYLQSLGQQQVISPLAKGMYTPSQTNQQHFNQEIENMTQGTNWHVATPTPTVTPTPTMSQTPDFSGFITSKVPQQFQPLIYNSAISNGVDPNVFASLLFSEHGFQVDNKRNYNTDGTYDRGIAQINSGAHPEVSEQQALDPQFAIPWAAKTLGGHIKKLGMKRGIVAYNTGESGSMNVNPLTHPYYKKVTAGLSDDYRKKLGL